MFGRDPEANFRFENCHKLHKLGSYRKFNALETLHLQFNEELMFGMSVFLSFPWCILDFQQLFQPLETPMQLVIFMITSLETRKSVIQHCI